MQMKMLFISEVHLLTDSEIIARVTQTQLDAAEHDYENERNVTTKEGSSCQTIKIL